MTLLKIKSIIYRYTNVYLAYREENEYLTSKDFWVRHIEIMNDKDNDLDPMDAQGLLIGIWQANHNFATPCTSYSFKRGFIPKIINRAIIIYKNLKWDIVNAVQKRRKS